jgi:hypothetical protein
MKKLLVTALLSMIAAGSGFAKHNPASFMDISLRDWYAFDSMYDEYPSPTTPGPMYIWGKFPSNFPELTVKVRVFDFLFAEGSFSLINILNSTMYLNSLQDKLTIDGTGWLIRANICFRVIESDQGYLDLYTGFRYSTGKKNFYDYSSGGSIVNPGNFGYYAFQMLGPQFGMRARFYFCDIIGLDTSISGTPYFENSSEVAGWSPTPKLEHAAGYNYSFKGGIVFDIDNLSITLGGQYEFLYYAYDELTSNDLTIRYAGPYVEVGYTF